ncbi:MAG: serine O-acetyltransferase [Thermoanaerobaculia bacterium]
MFDNLRADTRRLREIKSKPFPWYVLESLLFENGYQAVVLHRVAHWFKAHGVPFFGPLTARTSLFWTGVDIAPAAKIGPGLRIAHGNGLVVGWRAEIGGDALLMQQVTIGAPTTARLEEMPKIGDRVTIGAGAAVIGPVTVGDDVFIGAHALVTRDVPSGSKVLATCGVEIRPRRPESSA